MLHLLAENHHSTVLSHLLFWLSSLLVSLVASLEERSDCLGLIMWSFLQASGKNLNLNDESQHGLLMQLLKLTHNCLNFDFIGTSTDESCARYRSPPAGDQVTRPHPHTRLLLPSTWSQQSGLRIPWQIPCLLSEKTWETGVGLYKVRELHLGGSPSWGKLLVTRFLMDVSLTLYFSPRDFCFLAHLREFLALKTKNLCMCLVLCS